MLLGAKSALDQQMCALLRRLPQPRTKDLWLPAALATAQATRSLASCGACHRPGHKISGFPRRLPQPRPKDLWLPAALATAQDQDLWLPAALATAQDKDLCSSAPRAPRFRGWRQHSPVATSARRCYEIQGNRALLVDKLCFLI